MSDPTYNTVETNALESVGGKKMKPKKKTSTSWMDDGDSAHWVKSKPKRKASSSAETKQRFKKNTLTVKTGNKKSIKVKK